VRCTVAFSRAVYDGAATVTGVTARLAKDAADARRIIGEGEIPILIDPEYKEAKKLEPAVLVDAIIAKKNIGTKITDAPLVVGIGPGFTSGVDCHFCVESNRGHDMGRTLYEGSPEPDTATPGNVVGVRGARQFSTLHRASISPDLRPLVTEVPSGSRPDRRQEAITLATPSSKSARWPSAAA